MSALPENNKNPNQYLTDNSGIRTQLKTSINQYCVPYREQKSSPDPSQLNKQAKSLRHNKTATGSIGIAHHLN